MEAKGIYQVGPIAFISYKRNKAFLSVPKEVLISKADKDGIESLSFLIGQIEVIRSIYPFQNPSTNPGYYEKVLDHLIKNGCLKGLKYLKSLGLEVVNDKFLVSLGACWHPGTFQFFLSMDKKVISLQDRICILNILAFKNMPSLLKKFKRKTSNLTLFAVCASGQLKMVRELINHGLDYRFDEDLCLRYASSYGRLNVVKYLLNLGADKGANGGEAFRFSFTDKGTGIYSYLSLPEDELKERGNKFERSLTIKDLILKI